MTETISAVPETQETVEGTEQAYAQAGTPVGRSVDQIAAQYAQIVGGIKESNTPANIVDQINDGYDDAFRAIFQDTLYSKVIDALSKTKVTKRFVPLIERRAISEYLEERKEELDTLSKDFKRLERNYKEHVNTINELKKEGRRSSVDYLKIQEGLKEFAGKKSELEENIAKYKQDLRQNPYNQELEDKITLAESDAEKVDTNLEIMRDKKSVLEDRIDELGDEMVMKVREYAPQQTLYHMIKGKTRNVKRVITELERSLTTNRRAKSYISILKTVALIEQKATRMGEALETVYATQEKVLGELGDERRYGKTKKVIEPDYQKSYQLLQAHQQKKDEEVQKKIDLFLS